MTTHLIDERQMPSLPMVWPIERLPSAPQEPIPEGYALRWHFEPGCSAIGTLIASEWPGEEDGWYPENTILLVHAETGQPVATARTGRGSSFGGVITYVVVDPLHRGKGLGRAVTALAVARLMEAGCRQIFLQVAGWRLPAVRCYLRLGFVPPLLDDEYLPLWQRICGQIGWPAQEGEWPRSLAWESPGARPDSESRKEESSRKGTALLRKFRCSLLGRPVSFYRLVGDMLLLYIDCQPGDDDGYLIWLDPCWQVRGPEGVLVGSDFWLAQGEREAAVSRTHGVAFSYLPSKGVPAERYERAGAFLSPLIGEPVTGLEVKPGSNALAVEVGVRFRIRTWVLDPTTCHTWHMDNIGRRVALYGSPKGLEVVRRHGADKQPRSRDRRQQGDLHALNEDGLVLCNPRDREAAHRAEMEGIATDDRAAVTCRKCSRLLYQRDKARQEGR
jgi:mycothiol synthase